MRGDVEYPGNHYRPRHRELHGEDVDPSFSERGMFEELELLARTPELRRAWDRVRTAAIRGAAAGVLIKGGLHTLTFVMYLLSRIRGKGRQRVTTLIDVLRDTVLHTCFLATLGSSYTAVDEGIALIFGKASTQRWRALVAGLIAGQSLRITGSNRRHYSLATYILLRGLTLLVRTGNKPSAPPALRALLRPTRLQHGDTLLMCVATSQILYSFIMAPSTLPTTYVRFIARMGGKDPAVWTAIREHALRNSLGLAPGPLQALQGTPLAFLNVRPGRLLRTPCEFFHPGQSCATHAVSILPQAYGTSLAVYVPFYLVSSVLVHRSALLARPRELLPKMAMAVLRSSSFLSAYIAAAFAGACTGFCATGINTGAVIAGSVWAGGLATLLEKKSRRMELAMYCAARALEAFIRCCWLWGSEVGSGPDGRLRRGATPVPLSAQALRRPLLPGAFSGRPAPGPSATKTSAAGAAGSGGLRLDVLMFSLGCGAIMHCFSDSCGQHRDVFRSKYLNVLDFIFGNQGVQQGSISHVPTNLELVSNVGRRLRTMSRGVLSSGENSISAATFSPLPRSAAHSQADGLGLNSPAESGYMGVGHNHHGGHGYSRYLQLQHQRHQQHQQLLQQLVAGKGSSGSGLGEHVSPLGGLRSSLSSGAAQAAGKPPMAPQTTYSRGGSNPVLSASAAHAAAVDESSLAELKPVSSNHHGESTATAEVLEATFHPEGEQAMPRMAIAAGNTTAATQGRSAGGSSSHSSSEWEDVWASATGSSPNAAAAASGVPTEAAALASPAPAAVQAAAIGSMPRISSAPMVSTHHAVRRSPFAASSSRHASTAATAVANADAAAAPGTLSWAARLMAGAFNRVNDVGSTALSSRDAAAMSLVASALKEPSVSESCAVPTASSEAVIHKRERGGSSSSLWGFGRHSSMRRINTAPHGLQMESAQALLLLADPSSEHCGHGRSSYKELQRLSVGGNCSLAVAAAMAAGVAGTVTVAEDDAPSPASTSSTSPAAVEEAAALFPVPMLPSSPQRDRRQHDSASSSPSGCPTQAPSLSPGRRVTPPSRARPVPVPNACSRTPAFRPRRPLNAAGACRSSDAAVGALVHSLPRGGSSLSSSLDHLPVREGFTIHSVRLGTESNNSIPKASNKTTTTTHRNGSSNSSSCAGGVTARERASSGAAAGSGSGSALTFELHGALSHPSPVPSVPVWPRLSLDTHGAGAVSRSAPEAREGVLAAVLAATAESTSIQHALDLEVEVEMEVEAQEARNHGGV